MPLCVHVQQQLAGALYNPNTSRIACIPLFSLAGCACTWPLMILYADVQVEDPPLNPVRNEVSIRKSLRNES
jgi:hypothetical protein